MTPREETNLDPPESQISNIADAVDMAVTNKQSQPSSNNEEISATKRAQINEQKKKQKQYVQYSKTNYTLENYILYRKQSQSKKSSGISNINSIWVFYGA